MFRPTLEFDIDFENIIPCVIMLHLILLGFACLACGFSLQVSIL